MHAVFPVDPSILGCSVHVNLCILAVFQALRTARPVQMEKGSGYGHADDPWAQISNPSSWDETTVSGGSC